MKEADAAVGVRHISLDCSPQGEKRLRAAVPGYYPIWLKRGQATAIVEDTCVNAYDIYLTTHKGASERVVQLILKNTWENIEKLPPIHPSFRDWTKHRAVDTDVTIPYHPGAVQFFREHSAWSPTMKQLHLLERYEKELEKATARSKMPESWASPEQKLRAALAVVKRSKQQLAKIHR